MNRLQPWFIPLLLLAIPALVVHAWGTQFSELLLPGESEDPGFEESRDSDQIFSLILDRMPYVVLGIAALLGWRFNQTRISFLSIFLIGIYWHGILRDGLTRTETFIWWLSLCIAFVAFFWLRERRLISLFGVRRLAFVAVLLFLPKLMEHVLLLPGIVVLLSDNAMTWKIPRTDIPAVVAGVFPVTILPILFRQLPAHRLLKSGFIASFSAAAMGLSGPSQCWPVGTSVVVANLYFTTAGILFGYSIYCLSWGKAYTDELTGVSNRRALEEAFDRLGSRYSIAMVDVDHFKKFNDKYGHQTGDDVLRLIARTLVNSRVGRVFRYGGEEFTILCPGKSAESIVPAVDELRKGIASRGFIIRSGLREKDKRGKTPQKATQTVKLTVSIGVADRSRDLPTPVSVVEAADHALYAAKKMGRNRVACKTTKRKKRSRKS